MRAGGLRRKVKLNVICIAVEINAEFTKNMREQIYNEQEGS